MPSSLLLCIVQNVFHTDRRATIDVVDILGVE